LALGVLVLPSAAARSPSSAAPPVGSSCPVAPDPATLPDAAKLREENSLLAALGLRATGTRAQNVYIKWILKQLKSVPGAQVAEQRFTINRWTPGSMELQLNSGGTTSAIPIAAPVPYAKATRSAGVSAPLALIPDEEQITAANAAGK